MHRTLLPLIALTTGCVLDRTGQSATEVYRREVALQSARVANIEKQFDGIDGRVAQIEELNRTRGQDEILKLETLEEVRAEVARMRGEVEVLGHAFGQSSSDALTQQEDASFRLMWLEERADLLEKSMGLATPPPPARESVVSPAEGAAEGTGDAAPGVALATRDAKERGQSDQGITDPDAMIKLAEEHLAAGREPAAEAVLNRFIDMHPKHEKVAEAKYRRAEAAFNAKNYPASVLRFQEVIDGHKKSIWAPWAMLRQGEAFEEQGQKPNAKLFYEEVVRAWPKSKAAAEARAKLK
ncbi:MAG: tetratricopeptide repeat protein [Myxococcota bacterium]|nr:tetratricopeptide repeat protein [Myxococcota bacterium]